MDQTLTAIKNKIIEKSLSLDWINSIDKQTKDELNYGLSKIENFEFKEAIISLLEFIEHSQPTTQKLEICNYNLGFAYYKLEKFHDSIEYFSNEYIEYKNEYLFYKNECLISNI